MTKNLISLKAKKLKEVYEMIIDKLELDVDLRDFYPQNWTEKQVKNALLIRDEENPEFPPYGLALSEWSEMPNVINFFHPNLILNPTLHFNNPNFHEINYRIIQTQGREYFPEKTFQERSSLIKKMIKYDIEPASESHVPSHILLSKPLSSLLKADLILRDYNQNSEEYKVSGNPILFWLSHSGLYFRDDYPMPYLEFEKMHRDYVISCNENSLIRNRFEHKKIAGSLRKTISKTLSDFANVLTSCDKFTFLNYDKRMNLRKKLEIDKGIKL